MQVVEFCQFCHVGSLAGMGEDETKLYIEPGALITEVRPASWLKYCQYNHSRWLEGTFEGRVGLVPNTCVEDLP